MIAGVNFGASPAVPGAAVGSGSGRAPVQATAPFGEFVVWLAQPLPEDAAPLAGGRGHSRPGASPDQGHTDTVSMSAGDGDAAVAAAAAPPVVFAPVPDVPWRMDVAGLQAPQENDATVDAEVAAIAVETPQPPRSATSRVAGALVVEPMPMPTPRHMPVGAVDASSVPLNPQIASHTATHSPSEPGERPVIGLARAIASAADRQSSEQRAIAGGRSVAPAPEAAPAPDASSPIAAVAPGRPATPGPASDAGVSPPAPTPGGDTSGERPSPWPARAGRDDLLPAERAALARANAVAPVVASPVARAVAAVASVPATVAPGAELPAVPPSGARLRGDTTAAATAAQAQVGQDMPAGERGVAASLLAAGATPVSGRDRDRASAGEAAVPDVRRGVELAAPLVVAVSLEPRDSGRSAAMMAGSAPAAGAVALDDVLPTQIIRSIRLQWQVGHGEAKVQLRPEHLGELTVAIKVDHGVVVATLHAEKVEVRRWIESHSPSLRDALAEQGLRLDRLIVADDRGRHDEATADRRQRQADPEGETPSRRRRPRGDHQATRFDLPTSELHERTYA